MSFPLDKEYKRLYHYCKVCGENTFHEILGYVEGTADDEIHGREG
ncbi:MAG: hypothetical protein ABWK00_06255 [Desulfurococcaceae archaeon]